MIVTDVDNLILYVLSEYYENMEQALTSTLELVLHY